MGDKGDVGEEGQKGAAGTNGEPVSQLNMYLLWKLYITCFYYHALYVRTFRVAVGSKVRKVTLDIVENL